MSAAFGSMLLKAFFLLVLPQGFETDSRFGRRNPSLCQANFANIAHPVWKPHLFSPPYLSEFYLIRNPLVPTKAYLNKSYNSLLSCPKPRESIGDL